VEAPLDGFGALSFTNPSEWIKQVLPALSTPAPAAPAIERRTPISDFIHSASNKIVFYLRKVISATLIVASSLASPITNCKAITKPLYASAAVVGGVIAAPLAATAGVFRKYTKLSPTQRLATTPLFYLTNSNGQPFLQEDVQTGNPEQRIIVYFMSSEDAYDYLDEMAQASGSGAGEFRVMATSMEKVVNKIQAKKQSRKLGRYPVGNIYRIQPSIRQCEHAEKALGQSKKVSSLSIPMFSAKGLAIKRSTGEVVTPFYFSYEDLKEDWSKLSAQGQGKLVVSVHDFTEVMLLSKGVSRASVGGESTITTTTASEGANGIPAAALSPAIVPPRREIEMLRRYYRNEAGVKNEHGQARIVGVR
jgi:Tic22-like family